ncbi:MAG: cyclodeaminase/cyclohydrolase family protein [Lachnospiraceae bacterium]|nr:cyclodeaminase/cyclohydrolase family protein [Lachnospiraceae bacterium]
MREMTIEAFAQQTASSEPVPGGGSISALAGALAAALTEMVAGLTIGKKKYADVQSEMEEAIPVMQAMRGQLLDDIKRDSESFDLYMQALSLPKDTEDQRQARSEAMQAGLRAAVAVPLSVARNAVKILPYAEVMITKGNKTAVTDGLVAAMMARTAVLGALYNVKINLQSIKDEAFIRKISGEVEELEEKALAMEREIMEKARL